jgi:hypothetical protein
MFSDSGMMISASSGSGGSYPTVQAFINYAHYTGALSHVLDMPAGVVAGELLLALTNSNGPTLFSAIGWTNLFGAGLKQVLYKIADGTEGATQAVTTSTYHTLSATVLRISGANAVTPIDVSAIGAVLPGSQIYAIAPSVTPAVAGTLLIQYMGHTGSVYSSSTVDNGVTKITDWDSGVTWNMIITQKDLATTAATGSTTATWTSAATNSQGMSIAIQP